MARKRIDRIDIITDWVRDNYFQTGLLTLTPEEIAYIINNYVVTYAINEPKRDKTCCNTTKEKR